MYSDNIQIIIKIPINSHNYNFELLVVNSEIMNMLLINYFLQNHG